MTRNLSFLILAVVLVIVIAMIGLYFASRLRASARTRWEDLLMSLVAIDRTGVDRVALDAIDPSGERRTDQLARELEPNEIWKLLGGIDGIKKLEMNSHVLIEMAAFLQRSVPEAAVVAEDLRLQAKELEWHVERLRMAHEQGSLEFHIPTYAQNAAITYYLMEQRLQALCQRKNVPTFRFVQKAH